MEMHQVRYFLAVARTSNFTRAAEECNVAQPSLTRAIKLLEGEFGGDLFRRERPAVMLTPLGEKMYPLLKQCYESAQSARTLATQMNEGQAGTLKLAVSSSIELGLILPHLTALRDHFRDVDLKILRGSVPQLLDLLKSGEAELAVAASPAAEWDRLDTWPLYEEPFELVFGSGHRLAAKAAIAVDDLKLERFLVRNHCESRDEAIARLGLADRWHEVSSDQDLIALVDRNIGVSLLPQTVAAPPTVRRAAIDGVAVQRSVHLYGVAGRQRSPVAATFMKMLRAASWPKPH